MMQLDDGCRWRMSRSSPCDVRSCGGRPAMELLVGSATDRSITTSRMSMVNGPASPPIFICRIEVPG